MVHFTVSESSPSVLPPAPIPGPHANPRKWPSAPARLLFRLFAFRVSGPPLYPLAWSSRDLSVRLRPLETA
eukprot:4217537-Pyramimonas_sp.AAC.1